MDKFRAFKKALYSAHFEAEQDKLCLCYYEMAKILGNYVQGAKKNLRSVIYTEKGKYFKIFILQIVIIKQTFILLVVNIYCVIPIHIFSI